ncbi:hypothetical protein [Chryseobacterium sp. CFS15]|uniref:hypothetical protein n=1 Tax=Chryseobacterium sp. CFS15 TaxID=2986946 RepID=UPI00280725E8|nr:hypothetical protein [Chryseobacterium sp. CFS15]MDQ8144402.1 hypothetical protein [Chryseobacterium sp. CFS15]
MIKKTILLKFLLRQIFLLSLLLSGIIYAQTGPNDDFDGDGIINSIDIDDDNDGVPDATESPNCYYTASEIAIPASVTTTVAHSGTIANLYDNNPATLFNFTHLTTKVNLTVFEVTPIRPVAAAGLQIEMNNYGQTEFSNTAASLTLEGWNGTAWVTLMPAFNPSTAPNTAQGLYQTFNFTQNQNTAYSKFRLQGLAGTIVGSQIREVKLLMPDNYISSRYPKTSCTDANIDGDNILPHFDLDSDGDGYSDALEAGATTNTASNYQFPDVDANNDGLVDAVDADNNGYVNYNSTYFEYALNKNISATADSDGDGIADDADLDDDNDGIPDTVECGSGIQTIAGGVKNLTETLPSGLNASNALYSQYGLIIRERSKVAPYNIVRDNFNIVSHSGDADNEYIFFADAVSYSFEYYNPFTNQKRLVDRIQVSAEPATDGSTLTLVCFDDAGTVIYTGTFPDGSTMSVDTTQTLNNSKIHRFIVSGSNNTTGFDQVFVQGMSVFAGGCDTDGDAVPNHLDLDSDGDGCSDLAESGVSPVTDVSTPASINNNVGSSYGIAANKLTGSQLNLSAADTNNDGLNDSIDSDVNGVPNYTSTYNLYATNLAINACTDTDDDGINDLTDIDDDNDGILDITEAQCATPTYTSKAGVTVSSTVTWNGALSLLVDGADTANQTYPNGATIAAQTVLQFDFPSAKALKQIELSTYLTQTAIIAGAVVQMQGWNGVSWENIGSQITVATPTTGIANPAQLSYKFSMPANLYSFTKYRIYGISGNVQANWLQEAYFSEMCANNDTDGDGIPNILDLDSDGDGCPDALEAGVSTNAGASASMSASGGTIYTGGIPSGTANAYVGNGTPAQYGANGFFNGIETTVDSGLYNGTYTYPFAISNAISLCADTDADGINDFVDIDDDNDGVVDALESPSCFYTASEWNTGAKPFYGVTISSGLTTTTANFSQLIDGISGTTAVAFSASPAQSNANANVYLFNFAQPVKLDALYLQFNTTTQFGGVTKIQGSNTNNGSDWVDLSASIAAGPATNITANGAVSVTTSIKYPLTLNTATAYKYIRITGGATASNMIAANASEVYFDFNNASYIASSYPKTTCASDTDGDGILNHLDLDSDGDGCSDAMEGGATSNLTANYKFTGPVGTNGLDNSLETADNGIVTYVSTYNMYAIKASIKACTDTDGDGIVDVIDIDDDNDGVLDVVESPPCAIVDRDDASNVLVWDFEQTLHTLPTTEYNAAQTQPYSVRTFGPGVVDVSGANVLKFTGATAANFDDAVANGDYMQYYFTTTSTYLSIDKISNYTIQAPLKEGVIISTDPSFATYTVLTTGATTVTGGNIVYNTMDTYSNYPLNLNTRYYVRFIYYGLTGTTASYVDAVGLSFNGISNAESCLNGLDIDNDGIPNHLDLDSDGDGCPDAVEAGTATQAGAGNTSAGTLVNTSGTQTGVANAIVGNNTPAAYGTNGFYSGIETNDTSSAAYTGIYSYNQYAIVSTLNLCTDTDGDGIIDLNDIDDDNDGIADAVESPACFYTAAEANVISKITSQFTSPDDDQTDGDIQLLHDGAAALTFNFNVVAATANPTGSNLFTIEYPTSLQLATLSVSDNISAAGANAVVVGSNDGVTWSAALSPATLITATPTVFNITTTQPYKYYRIQTGSVPGALAATNTIGEITSTVAASYIPSAHQKAIICSVDTDGDGIPNHLDLDSDGDGCSDLAESGVSPATDIITPLLTNNAGGSYGIANPNGSQLNPTAADTNNDGLNDSVDADLNSITNYTSTYSNAINAAIASCTLFCYRPAVLSGTVLSTPQGITSLHRAGVDADNWPMVRKGAWTALEAKTKGFVPNRLTIAQINLIPAGDLREGMMVYNISSDCLYINTDGTPTGWKCFNTQACPD